MLLQNDLSVAGSFCQEIFTQVIIPFYTQFFK